MVEILHFVQDDIKTVLQEPQKFFPLLETHKSPLTPLFNKGGNFKELLLK
jgi:hypothetical protein